MKAYLERLGACIVAIEWVGNRTPAQAWAECERADWMLWLVANIDKTYSPRLRLAACACARTALPYTKDARVLACIETAERHYRGEATVEELRAARAAAHAATYAYAAADAAADAAYAADAAADDARKSAHILMCQKIREIIPELEIPK